MAGSPDSKTQESCLVETSSPGMKRCRVRIRGMVQGVGFRPFVFQAAQSRQLGGWVRNRSDGVEIEISGPTDPIGSFVEDLSQKAPPLARIVEIEVAELPFAPLGPFQILKSCGDQPRLTLISPDVCTCPDCLRELFDPADRRYRYPFINCTNCGPRYTIIRDIPYDRDKTTMAAFPMCPSCRREYEDPLNRRFHAQPNACWECGPRVWLENPDGTLLAQEDGAVREAVDRLEQGAIVAVKGLGGFHLAVDATREEAVKRLRNRKIREEKPFAVMFPDLEAIERYCRVSQEESKLLQSMERPIVLLERRFPPSDPPLASGVAPRNRFLGAFLPYTPLHFLLFHESDCRALVMTSGNRSDEPIVTDNQEARERLGKIADFFLFHNRDIYIRCDDSVTRVLNGKSRCLRRARGYVPTPVFLKKSVPPVLGVGAELKNTVCLTRGSEAFLSQHIGDLENLETLRSFEHTIAHLQHILDIRPELIVHDLHPDYLSTQWALQQEDAPRMAVQHHHAHIASVIAEHRLEGPVLGLALDGAGYGADGTLWGGELLRVDGHLMTRLGHLRRVLLPGGDKAVKEPWRMALSYLRSINPERFEEDHADFLARLSPDKAQVILQMLEKRLRSPLTSSCGRLFDAVSALVGIRDQVTYEGQAAVELEQALEPDDGFYEGEVYREEESWIIDPLPIIDQLTEDMRHRTAVGMLSARFHNGLIHLLTQTVQKASTQTGLDRIALSGGVFQNRYLSQNLEAELLKEGFEVYSHEEIPPNDACIALGQAYVGASFLNRRS